MTAWSILVANSTAPANSVAWIHLNNQAGGGSTIIIGGDLMASIDVSLSASVGDALSANIQSRVLQADTGSVLSANVNQSVLEATICQEQ